VGEALRIELDREAPLPVYRQVAEAIRGAIRSGELTGGFRLPATRHLATKLGINRNTVVAAYRRLEEEGWVRSAVGAGTFVSEERALRSPPTSEPAGEPQQTGASRAFSWSRLLRNPSGLEPDPRGILQPERIRMPTAPIRLNGAVPDSRQFPMREFASCVEEVLAAADPELLEYGSPEGYAPLRSWIIEWLREAGVEDLDPRRVFVVSGSQQGIDLLARLFLARGDCVILEEPTYTGAFMVLRQAGARVVTVPIDAQGIVPEALADALHREPVKLLYTMPCYQNPTGVSLSPARKDRILGLARQQGLAIIEDHYDSALGYSGEPWRPLLADEPRGQVIHLGTFSKILFPGLRLGWMVVPEELCGPLRQLRWATDLSSGTLTQRVMERFCRSGRLAHHLERLRDVNRRRLQVMLRALERHFPSAARWTRPSGGMTLWVELPEWMDTVELLREAAQEGVLFTPGSAFYPNGGGHSAMRLSFNREEEARIRRGVRMLGELIKKHMRTRRRGKRPARDAVPFI
jgi:DNA-binding transcriptional MocR family regulator